MKFDELYKKVIQEYTDDKEVVAADLNAAREKEKALKLKRVNPKAAQEAEKKAEDADEVADNVKIKKIGDKIKELQAKSNG